MCSGFERDPSPGRVNEKHGFVGVGSLTRLLRGTRWGTGVVRLHVQGDVYRTFCFFLFVIHENHFKILSKQTFYCPLYPYCYRNTKKKLIIEDISNVKPNVSSTNFNVLFVLSNVLHGAFGSIYEYFYQSTHYVSLIETEIRSVDV